MATRVYVPSCSPLLEGYTQLSACDCVRLLRSARRPLHMSCASAALLQAGTGYMASLSCSYRLQQRSPPKLHRSAHAHALTCTHTHALIYTRTRTHLATCGGDFFGGSPICAAAVCSASVGATPIGRTVGLVRTIGRMPVGRMPVSCVPVGRKGAISGCRGASSKWRRRQG